MALLDDLEDWTLLGNDGHALKAVGWLDGHAPYPRGEVTDEFFRALMNLLVNPWQPAATAGRHACSLCRFTGGPSQVSHKGITVTVGASNVFVPGAGVIYVAPSLVAHYVDAHAYRPPEEFIRAVIECPEMRSMAYLKAIKAIGGRGLIELAARR